MSVMSPFGESGCCQAFLAGFRGRAKSPGLGGWTGQNLCQHFSKGGPQRSPKVHLPAASRRTSLVEQSMYNPQTGKKSPTKKKNFTFMLASVHTCPPPCCPPGAPVPCPGVRTSRPRTPATRRTPPCPRRVASRPRLSRQWWSNGAMTI